MIFEFEVARLMPDGLPIHFREAHDEPWIDTLDAGMAQYQLGLDIFNRNLQWGRGSGYGWAHSDGERRLVGGKMLGPSSLHRWARDSKDHTLFYCAACGAAGEKTKEVPIVILPMNKKIKELPCSHTIK